MADSIEINRRYWDERATIHARDTTGDYMLERFLAGEDALHTIEASELGDISGKRVLDLQCHIGRDTLCLVRRGAVATGLDFSGNALDVARRLAEQTGLNATFVQATVAEARQAEPAVYEHTRLVGGNDRLTAKWHRKPHRHASYGCFPNQSRARRG